MTCVSYKVELIAEDETLATLVSLSATTEPPPVRLDIVVDCRYHDEMIAAYGIDTIRQ